MSDVKTLMKMAAEGAGYFSETDRGRLVNAADTLARLSHENEELKSDNEFLASERLQIRDEWTTMKKERDEALKKLKAIKACMMYMLEYLERPTYNALESGFRHHPLSPKEILERYEDTCEFAVMDLNSCLRLINEEK